MGRTVETVYAEIGKSHRSKCELQRNHKIEKSVQLLVAEKNSRRLNGELR